MKHKKIIINVMGKHFTIDNPSDITIIIPRQRNPFMFNLKIDEKIIRRLIRR